MRSKHLLFQIFLYCEFFLHVNTHCIHYIYNENNPFSTEVSVIHLGIVNVKGSMLGRSTSQSTILQSRQLSVALCS